MKRQKYAFTLAKIFFDHFAGQRKAAFTLAEILITLGIIGVVAAMTIPAVIGKYNEVTTIINLKKTYSELQQVIKLSEAENGDLKYWDFPKNYAQGTDEFVQKYFLPYMKHVTKCTGKNYCFKNSNNWTNPDGTQALGYWYGSPHYKYNDKGMVFAGFTHEQSLSSPCSGTDSIKYVQIAVDVNGSRGHSIFGKDVFFFQLLNYSKKCPWSVGDGNYYGLYLGGQMGGYYASYKYPYETVLQSCQNGDYSNCGLAIQMNGWKKPEGYPLKF